jgi:hypothetical protein
VPQPPNSNSPPLAGINRVSNDLSAASSHPLLATRQPQAPTSTARISAVNQPHTATASATHVSRLASPLNQSHDTTRPPLRVPYKAAACSPHQVPISHRLKSTHREYLPTHTHTPLAPSALAPLCVPSQPGTIAHAPAPALWRWLATGKPTRIPRRHTPCPPRA